MYTAADTQKMMDEFEARRAEVGDGGNFKISTCNAVAAALNPPDKGAPKTGKSVKNKYESVRYALYFFSSTHDAQLKGFWDEVIKINNNSGWPPFDKLLGANITPERAPVWDDWVAKNPKSKNFRNAGFDFYDQFDTIIPLVSAIPKGRNVYRAGQASLLADLGLESACIIISESMQIF